MTHVKLRLILIMVSVINVSLGSSLEKTRTQNFNMGWKFQLGDLPEAPIGLVYDDSLWKEVSLPHTLIQAHRWMLDGDPKREEKLSTNTFPSPPDDKLQSNYHRTFEASSGSDLVFMLFTKNALYFR